MPSQFNDLANRILLYIRISFQYPLILLGLLFLLGVASIDLFHNATHLVHAVNTATLLDPWTLLTPVIDICMMGLAVAVCAQRGLRLLTIKKFQRNIVALKSLLLPHVARMPAEVTEYAGLAFRKHNPARKSSREATTLPRTEARFLKWWYLAPDSLTVFSERTADGQTSRLLGGFWLLGLDKSTYEDFKHSRRVEIIESPKAHSSLDCHAILVTGVTSTDSVASIIEDNFSHSHVVLSQLFTEVRRICRANGRIESIILINRYSDETHIYKIFNFVEIKSAGELPNNMRLFEGSAAKFRDDLLRDEGQDRT